MISGFVLERAPQRGEPPWVRLVIVNYNGGAFLQACVDALGIQTMGDFEAIIVDNASTDGSIEALCLPDDRFTIVKMDSNVGFAAANNLAARGCRSSWLATLNPDTRAEPDWLSEMRRGAERHSEARMFGATLVCASDPTIVDGFGDTLSITGIPRRRKHGQLVANLPADDCETFAPCAAAALYDRQMFDALGGFDEQFFCYIEDVDLGLRLRSRGERCIQLRRAVVHHQGSASTGALSAFTIFHTFRNRLWLLRKNFPLPLLLIAVPANLLCSAFIIFFKWSSLPVTAAVGGLLCGLTRPAYLHGKPREHTSRRFSSLALARHLTWNAIDFRSKHVRSAAMARLLHTAIRDLYSGFMLHRVWMTLAHEDIGDQHRLTTLGPLWLLINYLAYAGTFVFFFPSGSSSVNYPAYIAVGLFVWFYIMETISQSVSLFVREESFINGTTLPLSVYVFRLTMQSIIRAGYALVGCLGLLAFSGITVSANWAWAALGIAVIVTVTPAAAMIFAFLGAFFRDSQYLVSNLMRIGMFLTPVFWTHDGTEGGFRHAFYYWNPFTYFLEIVRTPILANHMPVAAFIACAIISASTWVLALLLLGLYRKQIVFVI